jgi:K+-sensing histidine kinase KdpD
VSDDPTARLASATLGFLAALAVGALLVVIRSEVDNSVTALVLALAVTVCGVAGGWAGGLGAAAGAALAFNFWHTQPYLSLRIHDFDDILTTATLFVVAVVSGTSSWWARRMTSSAHEAHGGLQAVERLSDLLATGAATADLESAACAELLVLLNLGACSFEPQPPAGLPRLDRHGQAPDERVRRYHREGFELPASGVVLPVLAGGVEVGGLVCTPMPGTGVSLDRRRAAVAVADLLGAAHATRSPGRPSTA